MIDDAARASVLGVVLNRESKLVAVEATPPSTTRASRDD
jgi:hypothetical protein